MKANLLTPVCPKVLLLFLVVSFQDECFAADVPKSPPPAKTQGEQVYDLVVYGDSSGAVIAAVAAKREGRSVILVNPTGFLGGMSASGLGATDFLGKRGTFGGIASEFYDAIAAAYGTNYIRSFEPHVGRQVFEKLIADAGVPVVYSEKLDRTPGTGVKMTGRRIESITTLSGQTYRGKMFLDATYVGDLWINAYRSPDLPNGARGTSYGCMGGMIRLPVSGRDILLYSNLDTDAGEMPAKVGESTSKGREKIIIWASFDGGRTWPVKRLVYDGPGGYSNLGVGRTGTPSQGRSIRSFLKADRPDAMKPSRLSRSI